MAQSIDEILTPEKGSILRKAREARGLSINDVAARLRLNLHYIEAMEAGDIRPLPPGPYRKAFLTEYAKFLNIKLEMLQPEAIVEEKDNILASAVSAMPGVAKKMTKSAVKTTESVVKKVEEGVKDAVEEITARDLWEEADQVREERLGITKRKGEERMMAIRKKDEAPVPRSTFRRQEREFIPESPQHSEEPEPLLSEPVRSRRLETQENISEGKYPPPYKRVEEKEIRGGMSRATKTIVGLLVIIAAIVAYSIFTKKQNPSAILSNPEEKTVAKQPEQKPKPIVPFKKDSAAVIASSNDSLIFTISAKDSVWVSVSPDIGNGFRGKLGKGEVRRFSAKEKYLLFLGNQKSVSMILDGKPLANLPTVPGSNIVVRNAILTRNRISVLPSEEHKLESKKEILPKKRITIPVKKKPLPIPKKKAAKTPAIKMRIPSVKPVLPG